jgi:glycosyltransferase involved in cell wall biosynthesis
MHIIDTLSAAGAERVAVNIVNHLPRDRYVPFLCTTRREGPLEALVAPDVTRLSLGRGQRFGYGAALKLRKFIQANDIAILHVHSSSLFITRLAALGLNVAIIWHAHYGRYAIDDRFAFRYRVATNGISGVITVNEELAYWCSHVLGIPTQSVWYLPNPVCLDDEGRSPAVPLPGANGGRIVCVANFRREKDHFTLVRAMASVVEKVPQAHLLLVGKGNDSRYESLVRTEIAKHSLEGSISILGERQDVPAILRECDIGVLSSASEGLPMSLLEYGVAGLAPVATRVGQCADVLDFGKAGILVPASSVEAMSSALISLLRSTEKRIALAERFRRHVSQRFSVEAAIGKICDVYEAVWLQQRNRGGRKPAKSDVQMSRGTVELDHPKSHTVGQHISVR